MAVDERRRKALYDALEQRIGPQEATTLMELLPPVGWADVATKEDLHQLERRLDAKMDGLRAELRAEMERGFRRMIQWNVGVVLGGLAAVAAIARIL
jgi:hypothetical protein